MERENYFSLPYISSSSLHWFERSPLYCRKRMLKEIDDAHASYLDLGNQIHMRVLEPDKYEECYTVLDFEKPTSKNQMGFAKEYADLLKLGIDEAEALLTAYKNNYSTKNTSDKSIQTNAEELLKELDKFVSYLLLQDKYKEILSSSKNILIESVHSALQANKKANELLFDSNSLFSVEGKETYSELPIVWDFPIYFDDEPILKCKSMLDRLIIDHTNKEIIMVDLKTTFSLEVLKKDFDRRDYLRQLSFYWLSVQQFLSNRNQENIFEEYTKKTFVVIATTDPSVIETRVINFTYEEVIEKQFEIIKMIQEISWHVANDMWDHTKEYYLGDGVEKL